jgi:hypothetical protein
MKKRNAAQEKQRLDKLFTEVHDAGAKRHPENWLLANQAATWAIGRCGLQASDPAIRTVVSMVTLRVLDTTLPEGRK